MDDDQIALVWGELNRLDGLTLISFDVTEARFHLDQISATKRPETMPEMLRLHGIFSAFVMAYMRPFAKANNATSLESSIFPANLRVIHEQVKGFRNRRFAHNDAHDTVVRELHVESDPDGFLVTPLGSVSLLHGPQRDYNELVLFLEKHLEANIDKVLAKMTAKLGVPVRYPSGAERLKSVSIDRIVSLGQSPPKSG